MFAPYKALDVADYALAGGGFPIRVSGAGVIGAVIVSGLPQRGITISSCALLPNMWGRTRLRWRCLRPENLNTENEPCHWKMWLHLRVTKPVLRQRWVS